MKVLVTGMTARHTGTAMNNYLTVIDSLIYILRKDMGCEVDQRPATVNEDLSEYDKIIVYLFPIEKLGCTRRFGALDTLARYPDKCIVSFDDWQYYQFQGYIDACMRNNRFWRWVTDYPQFIVKADYDAIKAGGRFTRERLFWIARRLEDNIKFPILMPTFTWGSHNKVSLKTSGVIRTYDPSLYAMDYVNENFMNLNFPPKHKRKEWVLGSLFDHDEFIRKHRFEWPVKTYGHKKTMTVLNEEELCNVYNDSWGILSPKYKTSGDGWWRARWVYAYMFNCIILSSDEERGDLPEGFQPKLSVIENSTDEELERIVENQKYIMSKHFMPKDGVLSILNDVMKG